MPARHASLYEIFLFVHATVAWINKEIINLAASSIGQTEAEHKNCDRLYIIYMMRHICVIVGIICYIYIQMDATV